jgi:hypothetical protein
MDASTVIQPLQTRSSDTFMFQMSVYDIVKILHLICSRRRYAYSLFLDITKEISKFRVTLWEKLVSSWTVKRHAA